MLRTYYRFKIIFFLWPSPFVILRELNFLLVWVLVTLALGGGGREQFFSFSS